MGGLTARFTRAGAIAAALLALGACSTTPPSNPDNACAVFSQKRSWWDAVRDSERRWGVPPHVQLAIIRQESAFDHNARPDRTKLLWVVPWKRPSSAYGYPQATDQTWEQYKEETGRRFASRDSFSDSADFVGWYGAKSAEIVGAPKTDARRQYLAYHEGWGGYRQGTYQRKGWLVRVARDVDAQADLYARQLSGCRRDLNRRFFFF